MARKKRTSRPTKKDFYERVLSETERVLLAEAKELEGLDEEIALLRVRLSSLIAKYPEDTELLLRGVNMLVKAVATKYRLSKKARENLSGAITTVIKEVGGALYPEGFESGN